jgi:hypothetical protein
MAQEAPATAVLEKERKFPCKSCGANLLFVPGQESLKCTFCGHVEKIPQTAEEIKEYSFNDYLAKPRSRGYGDTPGERRDVRCSGCGAISHLDANIRATSCGYCGAPLVVEDGEGEKSAEDVITPEAVVPFKVSLEEAQRLFTKWIAALWFAPTALKRDSHAKQLHGVYRPFWTYDANTVSYWSGERGTYYYTTESYTTTEDGKTVTRTRQVRHTRWTPVSGVYNEFFDDVLIDAGKDAKHATKYGLDELKPYTPEFLSGFGAERYTVSCEDGWGEAKDVIADEIRAGVRSEIGGDEQRISSVNTAYSGITYKHILLPLWVSCYRFNNKSYCFQINGQTGEVAGDRPYSFWKIFSLVVLILAIIAGIVLLSQKPSKSRHHHEDVEDDAPGVVLFVSRDVRT